MLYDRNNRNRRPLPTILAALLGLVFCILRANGVEVLCATAGCRIYSGYTLFGLSIYVYGAIGFGLILVLALGAGRNSLLRGVLYLSLLAGLGLDFLFLGWQFFFWTCLSCLVVALLFGVAAAGALLTLPSFRRGSLYALLVIWLVAFVPVAVNLVKDVFLQPWPVAGPPDATVKVFFSPTCPACAEQVKKILADSALASKAAFYPVTKNDEDLRRLARLESAGGEPLAALPQLFDQPVGEVVPVDNDLRLRLLRNKMALARMGAESIPLILSEQVLETGPSFLPRGINPEDLLGPSIAPQRCSAFGAQGEECP